MKRGISPIVATVLLVIIAVAAGVLIWAWLSAYAEKNPTEQPALRERIKIEAVKYDRSAKSVTIYVRNIGDVKVKIVSAYILDAVTGNVRCSKTDLNVEIGIGQVSGDGDIVVDGNCVLDPDHPYIAKVATERGTEATYQFVASAS